MGLFETRENFEQITVYYNWQLVSKDADDNKFVDVFIAAKADFLISEDSSIISLKKNAFPPLNIVTLKEFSNMVQPQ